MFAKLTCGLACVVVAALPARATDIIYNTSVGPLAVGAIGTTNVPKFDPALGVLRSVRIDASGTVSGTWGVENTSSSPETIGSIAGVDFVGMDLLVYSPSGGPPPLNPAFQPAPVALTPFDGTLDYAGTSGVTFPFVNQGGDGSPNQEEAVYQDADLPNYIGAGTFMITVSNIATGSALSPNLQSSVSITGNVSFQIRYTYDALPAQICNARSWSGCPCSNPSSVGSGGCGNSLNPMGGKLDALGTASLSNDSLVLAGTRMTNMSALYFQGSTFAYHETVYGDGLRCVGGSVVRLGMKMNANGSSQYPGPSDPSVSVRGGITQPGTANYQVVYRDSGNFCTPSLYNATSGMAVMWTP